MRFAIGRFVSQSGWLAFPYATLAVNILGSFLIGYLAITLQQKWGLSAQYKSVILTGFLGGFTTFSAFSLEVVSLVEQGFFAKSLIYIVCTLVLGLGACALGIMLARGTLT